MRILITLVILLLFGVFGFLVKVRLSYSNVSYGALPRPMEGSWVIDKDKMAELLRQEGQSESHIRRFQELADHNPLKLDITPTNIRSQSIGRMQKIAFNVMSVSPPCAILKAKAEISTTGNNPLSNQDYSAKFCLEEEWLVLIDKANGMTPIEYYKRPDEAASARFQQLHYK